MAFPTYSDDADPDPTTQIPWPSARQKTRTGKDSQDGNSQPGAGDERNQPSSSERESNAVSGKRKLTTMNLVSLSVSMAGAQIAWTVELGYGTPFLLSLGLSEQLTSLVWLAGPISGLIAQPVIGAISDSSTSKYRRRYWIVLSTVVLVISTLALAYCQYISAFFVDLFGGGVGDWDPQRDKDVNNTAIGLAIFCFYLLDFALNALQASLRNLLLDITPSVQLNAGNAWHSRMTQAGNIVGYGFGFLPLANLPVLRWLGGGQFRKFCVVALIILVATVWITCYFHEEQERQETRKRNGTVSEVLDNIYSAVVNLPKPIRRVCYVQVFAFMGWFPFLFYSTTYVGQIMAYERQEEPNPDYATRTGELAMLLYSIVATIAGTLLPYLARRDASLLPREEGEDDSEINRIRGTVGQWRAEAARQGRPLRLPLMPFLLRNIWTGAMILFSLITFSTFFITTVVQAIVAISLVGICWAVACWVPFAIIMEFLKEMDEPTSTESERVSPHNRTVSNPGTLQRAGNERQPLLRRRSLEEVGAENTPASSPLAGGTILGIHNLAIVFPQFIVALVSSAIFHAVDSDADGDLSAHNTYLGRNGVAWVLRFGGLCTLVGALFARMVPPTRAEKEMRRRLAEMRELKRENADSP